MVYKLQRFITDILDSNGLNGERYSSWILQDIEQLVKGLPNYVKKFSKGVTDVASSLEKAVGLGGKYIIKKEKRG